MGGRSRICEVCGIRQRHRQGFFANFPKNEERCREWVRAVGNLDLVYLPIEKLHQVRFICADHFTKKDFNRKGNRLRKSAIPRVALMAAPLTDEQLEEFPLHVASKSPKKCAHLNQDLQRCTDPDFTGEHHQVDGTSGEEPVHSTSPVKTVDAIMESDNEQKQILVPTNAENDQKYELKTLNNQDMVTESEKELNDNLKMDYLSENVLSDLDIGIHNEYVITAEDIDSDSEVICGGCLSSDRNLYSINRIHELYELFKLMMNYDAGDRWEKCNQINDKSPLLWEYRHDGVLMINNRRACMRRTMRVEEARENQDIEQFLCWECQALLNRLVKFKLQVQNAQKYIRSLSEGQNHQNIDHTYTSKCLSQLGVYTKTEYDSVLEDNNREGKEERNVISIISTKQPIPAELLKPLLTPDISITTNLQVQRNSTVSSIRSGSSGRTEAGKIIKFNPVNPDKNSHYVTEYMTEEEMFKFRERMKQDPRYADAEFKCMLCIIGFNTKVELERHFILQHSAKHLHEVCSICHAWFEEGKLQKHLEQHYSRYMCKHCAHIEHNAQIMREHVRAHIVRRGDDIRAMMTGQKAMKDKSSQNRQQRQSAIDDASDSSEISEIFPNSRSAGKDGYKCSECNMSFGNSRARRTHVDRYHREGLICDHCKRSFVNKTTLIEHLKSFCPVLHPGPPPRQECPICQKLVREVFLRAHIKRHQETTIYSCQQCNKTFSHYTTYKGHLKYSRAHATDFKFKCPMCGKGYTSLKIMLDHFNYKHLGKTYKCTICEKELATRRCVIQHMRRTHNVGGSNEGTICPHCGRMFTTTKRLKEHEAIHTGERPLTCNVCHATFRQSSTLYVHRRRFHDIRRANKSSQSVQ